MLDNDQKAIIQEASAEAKEFRNVLKELETNWSAKLKALHDKLQTVVSALSDAEDEAEEDAAEEISDAKGNIEEAADTIKEVADKLEDYEVIDNICDMLAEAEKLS